MSWASLAGCCWGWKRASKFQKELSMKLLVGISENLKMVNIIVFIIVFIIDHPSICREGAYTWDPNISM